MATETGRPGDTATERLHRNWASLLQELRVVQTGLVALVGMHRVFFRQHRLPSLVAVAGRTAGAVAGGDALMLIVAFWIALPFVVRASRSDA